MFSQKNLGLLLCAIQFLSQIASAVLTYIPPVVGNVTSHADFISTLHTLDAPKVHNFNETTWDWWYFDTLDPNSKAHAVVVFFAASQEGFPFLDPGMNFTLAMVWLTLADGTRLPTVSVNADGACITTKPGDDGASGIWEGSGFSFESQHDLGRYTVKIDAPSAGVKGELVFNSAAPAHYPCSLNKPVVNMELLPSIGWANAMPDAFTSVRIAAKDSTTGKTHSIKFSGIGYHDKNWGNTGFLNSVQTWTWGHGRLGSYSLVWFDAMDWTNKEYTSAYVARDGIVLSANCHEHGVKVRPTGPGSATTYPPTANSTIPTGYNMEFELPEGLLSVHLSNDEFLVDDPSYLRWKGSMKGSFVKGRPLEGHGIWEQFNIPALYAELGAA